MTEPDHVSAEGIDRRSADVTGHGRAYVRAHIWRGPWARLAERGTVARYVSEPSLPDLSPHWADSAGAVPEGPPKQRSPAGRALRSIGPRPVEPFPSVVREPHRSPGPVSNPIRLLLDRLGQSMEALERSIDFDSALSVGRWMGWICEGRRARAEIIRQLEGRHRRYGSSQPVSSGSSLRADVPSSTGCAPSFAERRPRLRRGGVRS